MKNKELTNSKDMFFARPVSVVAGFMSFKRKGTVRSNEMKNFSTKRRKNNRCKRFSDFSSGYMSGE